jgi:hypothetical protein
MAKWYASNQPQTLEAGVAVAADDDVVVDDDAERLCHLGDLLRHPDVGGRRRGVARGVVVDEDEGARRELERPLHDLARVDRRMVDGSGLLHLVGDEGVALVEEQEPELS